MVFYLSCLIDHVAEAASWSAPVPIISETKRISTYVNVADGGSTVFADSSGGLFKLTRATNTPEKLWRRQRIMKHAPPLWPGHSFRSYTTMIAVTDQNGLVESAQIEILADSRTPVYINGSYYVLDNIRATIVETDRFKFITVIEAVDDLNGTNLTVSLRGSTKIHVNPQQTAHERLSRLDTKSSLCAACVPDRMVSGGTVTRLGYNRLVPSTVPDDDLDAVVAYMRTLGRSHASSPSQQPTIYGSGMRVIPAASSSHWPLPVYGKNGIESGLWSSVGDAFSAIKSASECRSTSTISFIEGTTKKTWKFIVESFGQVYQCLLTSAKSLLGAVQWVLCTIGVAAEGVLRFAGLCIEWDDVRRTNDMINNMISLWIKHQVSGLGQIKQDFDKSMDGLCNSLSHWAGIDNWSKLGHVAGKPAAESASNPLKDATPGSSLFQYHYFYNIGAISLKDAILFDENDNVRPPVDIGPFIHALLEALDQEAHMLSDTYDQLSELASKFQTMAVQDILRAIAGILS